VALGIFRYQTKEVSEFVGILEVVQRLILMMMNTRVVEFATASWIGLKHIGILRPEKPISLKVFR
jgi:hypothetical protein